MFNVFGSKTGKMDDYKKLPFVELVDLCEKKFGLKTVPIVGDPHKFYFKSTTDVNETVENLLKYADTFKYRTYFEDASPNQIAEGLAFRMNDMSNSFKVISNKFLLKGGE